MSAIIINKRVRYEYNILESYQAGLVLTGALVKAIREKRVVISSGYVTYTRKHLSLIGIKIKDVDYTIPLLVQSKEKEEIIEALRTKGLSCVPINIKRVGRWYKSEIAIVKGKKLYDKRETIKNRDLDREQQRQLKG